MFAIKRYIYFIGLCLLKKRDVFGGWLLLSLSYQSKEAGRETAEMEASLLIHVLCPPGRGPGLRDKVLDMPSN